MVDAKKAFFLIAVSMLVLPGFFSPTSGDRASQGVVRGEVGARLDDYLSRIAPFGFSGAALVARDGEIVLNDGYGMAIRSKGLENSAGTVFSTGSITKQFTAAAIMKLEMQGRLHTHDALEKHLGGVPQDKAGITLHHLLTHTAGVSASSGHDYDPVQRYEAVAAILGEPLRSEPGEKFEYSNAGYTLLAAVIERVSGQPYEEFLREQLFAPVGMAHTGYRLPRWDDEVVAHWYVGNIDNGAPLAKPYPYWNLIGNGGLLSTTEDMYRWYLALRGDSVLSADAKVKLFTPNLSNYAYGWDVRETEHGALIEHNGGSMLGNSAELMWFADADVLVVLFCNQRNGDAFACDAIKDKVVTLTFGGEVDMPPPNLATDGPDAKAFRGKYLLSSGGMLKASVEDGFLTLAAEGQDAVDALVSPDQADLSLYADLNGMAVAIFEAALQGDYTPLKDALATLGPLGERLDSKAERAYRARRSIDMMVQRAREVGATVAVRPLGTIRLSHIRGASRTVVGLGTEHGDAFFGVAWLDGRIVDLRPVASGVSARVTALPLSSTAFAGYSLAEANNVEIRFTLAQDGSVEGLTVGADSGPIHATRLTRPAATCALEPVRSATDSGN